MLQINSDLCLYLISVMKKQGNGITNFANIGSVIIILFGLKEESETNQNMYIMPPSSPGS